MVRIVRVGVFERMGAARCHIGLICPNLSTKSVRLVVYRGIFA
jgi:hypothetical protein